jgi:DNA helicase II / ATP-dependent DNA helicase PcrA
MLKLSKQKNELLKTDGHILVLGGPGSGKTFIALLKAKEVVENEGIKTGQKVLFLSFARATVARIEEQASDLKISKSVRQHLEINTYHGFAWSILKSHGYLINSSSPLRLLPPPEAASHLADVVGDSARETEKRRLFEEDGLIHFDLFSSLSAHLLSKSKSLSTIFCNAYPVIILDEFQDTNADEWNLIRLFGERSRLIALADAEQRIYEFRGADPARIGEFINAFNPTQFAFGNENNRSNGTDIVQFGNDLLTGENKKKKYNNVQCKGYPFRRGKQIHLNLKFTVLESCKRMRDAGKDNWSLAILVPTKKLMLEVSDFMDAEQDLPNGRKLQALKHEVALETAGPSLAAVLIAGLLEGGETDSEVINQLINNLCDHMRGRKGNDFPSKKHLSLSDALIKYIETGKIKGKNRQFIVSEIIRIVTECRKIHFLGDPANDWITVRKLLFSSKCEEIKQVAIDAQYLRLLRKGALLRSYLGEIWRNNSNYYGASDAVRNALLQEHFAVSTKTWTGINVMTIHKAKGKEFDEVIIYEGYYHGKIERNDADKYKIEQSRYALRVAVTRAIKRTTILTPSDDICRFL